MADRILGSMSRRSVRLSYFPQRKRADFAWDGRYLEAGDIVPGGTDSLDVMRSRVGGATMLMTAASGGDRCSINYTGVNGHPSIIFAGSSYYYGTAEIVAAMTAGSEMQDFACFAVTGPVEPGNTGTMINVGRDDAWDNYFRVNDGSGSNNALRLQTRTVGQSVVNENFPGVQEIAPATAHWFVSEMGVGQTLGLGSSYVVVANASTFDPPTQYGVGFGAELDAGPVLSTMNHWTGSLAFLALWFGTLPSVADMLDLAVWANGIWDSPA